HLQPVLGLAEEPVGAIEALARLRVDEAALRQRRQRRERLAPAQLRMAAAGDQLLGLGEELDLADATAAELDVVALDRDRAMAAEGVDLALHRVHLGDGGVVEMPAPDEGHDRAHPPLPAPPPPPPPPPPPHPPPL